MIFDCELCERPQNFSERARTRYDGQAPPHASHDFKSDRMAPYYLRFTFATCDVCGCPSLFRIGELPDGGLMLIPGSDLQHEGTFGDRVYPPDRFRIESELPRPVRDSLEEATRCFTARAFTACAVMVGRALEQVCVEHVGTQARTIHAGLQAMHERNVISQELLDWGNGLRTLRNVGAHAEDRLLSRSEAEHALDFLVALLRILYDLRPRFQSFLQDQDGHSMGDRVVAPA